VGKKKIPPNRDKNRDRLTMINKILIDELQLLKAMLPVSDRLLSDPFWKTEQMQEKKQEKSQKYKTSITYESKAKMLILSVTESTFPLDIQTAKIT